MWEPLLSVPSHPPLSCASNVPLSPLPFKHLPSELTENSKHKQRFITYPTKATEFIETQMAEPSKTEPYMFLTWDTSSCLFYIPMECASSYFIFLLITLYLPPWTTLHTITIINLRSCVLVKSAAEGRWWANTIHWESLRFCPWTNWLYLKTIKNEYNNITNEWNWLKRLI